MRAVVYHADAVSRDGMPAGDLYERLFRWFREQCHRFDIPLVHLTLTGFPGWGDENIYFDGLDAANIVANREECFTSYLSSVPDGVYWFTEADCKINKMWPELRADCALLYRTVNDAPMNQSWRLARPSALPLFTEIRDAMREEPVKDWGGETEAFRKVWLRMGSPKVGTIDYKGMKIEMRDYTHYVKHSGLYCRHAIRIDQKEALCTSL